MTRNLSREAGQSWQFAYCTV